MKKLLFFVIATAITIPPSIADTLCNTCAVNYQGTSTPTWTKTSIQSSTGGYYYTTKGRLPTRNAYYSDACLASCYPSDYSDIYTCGPGYRVASTGASGYKGSNKVGEENTRVFGGTAGFVCIICPHGAYSNIYGQEQCKLCPAGYQTTGSGGTDCYAKCSGYDYTETWATTSLSSNGDSVANVCTATKCKAGAYLNGKVCTACPAGTYNPSAGATSSSACKTCPTPTDVYTDAARTVQAQATSDTGGTYCYLPPGTYYDETGSFTVSSNCPY